MWWEFVDVFLLRAWGSRGFVVNHEKAPRWRCWGWNGLEALR